MIQRLIVKNYAIIEELEVEFSDKLTIITGETGAGKSILLGALGLIMGNRADSKSLFNKTKKCIIEGSFYVENYDVQDFFTENDIDYDAEVIIRRELTPSGKSRAFINDTPVNLGQLKQLTSALIDMHQQFDTMDIHQVSFQLRMIDALAGNKIRLTKYKQHFKQYQATKKKLQALISKNESAAKELDYLNFQLEEFLEAELIPNEQETLETEFKTLSNAEDIKIELSKAYQIINESESACIDRLNEISHSLEKLKDVSPSIATASERLDSLIFELKDVGDELASIADETEHNEARTVEVKDRLDIIYKLQTKHSAATLEELLEKQEKLQAQIDAFSDLTSEIAKLEGEIDKLEDELGKQAAVLSKKRKEQVAGFEKKVHRLLALLSMQHSAIKVDISDTEKLTSTGTDKIEFLFSPNKGSRFESIKDVASGGELSRLTLCTKSLVADAIPLPTLIYDEIDAGVSGDVALKMGQILADLSNRHQVITITHTPQIASKADKHYFVYKKIKGNNTFTSVKQLSREERIVEIATMLSGSPPTPAAVDNAEELLQRAAD